MSEVILVASGKGGTGKSMVVANLGTLLAKANKRVLLIDMDMGARNLDLYLGLEDKIVYNIMDVVSGLCSIRQALIKDKRFDTLYLMSATPGRDKRDITPLHMEVLHKKIKKIFDYIIIDCPAGIGEGVRLAAAISDKALIITEADIAAARDASVLNQFLNELGVSKSYYAANKLRPDLMEEGLTPNLEVISSMLNGAIIGAFQYDDNILISSNKGIPIVLKEGTYIEERFKEMALRLLKDDDNDDTVDTDVIEESES